MLIYSLLWFSSKKNAEVIIFLMLGSCSLFRYIYIYINKYVYIFLPLLSISFAPYQFTYFKLYNDTRYNFQVVKLYLILDALLKERNFC